MSGWDISPEAEQDLCSIALELTRRDPGAAERFIEAFVAAADRLGDFPDSGHPHGSLPEGLRCVRVEQWLAVYKRLPSGVAFQRILPARADLGRYFRESQAAYQP